MICQNCGKNEASTHIKQIVNGDMAESWLCSECAAHLGYNDMMPGFDFGFGSLLGSLFGDMISTPAIGSVKRCEKCGITFDEIARTGKVGCSECYNTFYDRLLPSIRKVHGKNKHVGKISKGENLLPMEQPVLRNENKIAMLKAKMSEAVENEDFETAAKLRDEIKKLNENN